MNSDAIGDLEQPHAPYFVSAEQHRADETPVKRNKGKARAVTFSEAEFDFADLESPLPDNSENLEYPQEDQDDWGDDELDGTYDEIAELENDGPRPSAGAFLHGNRGEGTGMVWGDSDDERYAGPVQHGPAGARVRGGRAALPKPVTADLDSEDEIILRMKEDGFTDQQVVNKLKEENRVRYDRKTIGSRFLRIQAALAAKQDERLEAEETDWHEGEDELLLEAVAFADARIALMIQKIESRRYNYASDQLHKLKPASRYSPKAVHERYTAIMADTAHIPYELDDNPEQRHAERAERVRIKRAAREKEAAEKAAHAERLRVYKEEQAMKHARKREEAAIKRARDAAAKAQRAQKIAEKQIAEAEKAEQRRAEMVEKATLLRAGKQARERQEAARKALKALVTAKKGAKSAHPAIDPALSVAPSTIASSPPPHTPARNNRAASTATVASTNSSHTDPRSSLTVVELQTLVGARGLPRRGTKVDLVTRLAEADDKLNVEAMRKRLRELHAQVGGKRDELLARLAEITTKAVIAERGSPAVKKASQKEAVVIEEDEEEEEEEEEEQGKKKPAEGGVAADDAAENAAEE